LKKDKGDNKDIEHYSYTINETELCMYHYTAKGCHLHNTLQ